MAKKKKINGLSMAIAALSVVIVGIIILIIILVYFHMKEDTDNQRGDTTTTDASAPVETTDTEPVKSDTVSDTEKNDNHITTEPEVTDSSVVLPQTYNKDYFSNDLFIGDSIFTGLYMYHYLDINNVYAAVGLNPESALNHEIDGISCVKKAETMQPRNIYIMLGTNGLAYYEGSYMAKKMLSLIEALEGACPTAKICIISIPPVTEAHEAEGNETMAKVESYNAELKAYCDQGGYTFIDICSGLKDDEGYFSSKYAEADGLHFLGGTYQAVLGYIEKVMD